MANGNWKALAVGFWLVAFGSWLSVLGSWLLFSAFRLEPRCRRPAFSAKSQEPKANGLVLRKLLRFLFSFSFAGSRGFALRPGHTGNEFLEGLFGSHFLLTAFVVLVLMLSVARPAAHFYNFFTNHGDHGMVHGAFAAGTMIVDVVT